LLETENIIHFEFFIWLKLQLFYSRYNTLFNFRNKNYWKCWQL